MALHLYSMECEVSREENVRDFISVPSPDSTKGPSLIPPSVIIRYPMPSYQFTVGILWRWGDFLITQLRVKFLPFLGVVGEVVINTLSVMQNPMMFVCVQIMDDELANESNEQFSVSLVSASMIKSSKTCITIVDNDGEILDHTDQTNTFMILLISL